MPKAQKNRRSSAQQQIFRGAGMVYAVVIFLLTLAGILLCDKAILASGMAESARFPMMIGGLIVAVSGLVMYYLSVKSYRDKAGRKGKVLITEGIYAWVRHPMYLGITLVCDGTLMCTGNLWLLLLIPLYHVYLASVVKEEDTELAARFGDKWKEYSGRVKGTIALPPRR